MHNLSPRDPAENTERHKVSHHLKLADLPESKSDNAIVRSFTYQENSYLSRKIERQGQMDYYQRNAGQIKRPQAASQELERGELSSWKKTVYTNMTSRVLDGHRKQEALQSSINWNS